MLIRLEHNGVHLHEADTATIAQEILIGRSSQCTWRVPADDKDVSSRHARITGKGGTFWIEDLDSSNGTFHHGKAIKKLKLKTGMRIGIGACFVVVEDGGSTSPAEAIPELVILSGKDRGEHRELRPGTFTVGSDPESSLCLLDMLVSRHHAEIVLKDDRSCWIKDLGSKNGTTVNDTPLRGGQERLLKDGDRITFAQFEARFHDGTKKRSNTKTWIRLGVMVGTVLVVAAAYAAVQRIRPSAGSYLAQSRAAAAQEDFEAARRIMDKAARARGAETRELELSDLSRLVNVWDSTVKTWANAQESLAAGDWVPASRDLGMLYTLKQDAWTWKADASDVKNEALRAKALLDTLLHASSALRGEETGGATMAGELEAVRKTLASHAGNVPDYLAKARTELVETQGKLELFLSESRGLESALDSLALSPPPFAKAIAVLDETVRNSRGLLKRRSELMIDPVKALARSQAALDRAVSLVHAMKFEEALLVEIDLPSTSACALDSRVSAARSALETAHGKLQNQVNQLIYLFREAGKFMPDPNEKHPPAFAAWKDREALNNMLNCDSLYNAMPRRSRKEASGDYDRYLGIEEFYEFMIATSLRQPWKEKSDAPFQTVLFQTRGIVDAIESIQAFFAKEDWAVQLTAVNTPDGVTRLEQTPTTNTVPVPRSGAKKETEWLLGGQLAERVAGLRTLLAERDELVASMLKIATEHEDRPALMAAGIACRLAENPATLKVKEETLEKYLVRSVQDNRARLRDLGQQYDLAAPPQQIELRKRILTLGLPGDPIVKRMWSSSTAGQ